MSTNHVYVRLAPYAPRQGNLVQRYVYRGQLFTGGDSPTWYKVSKNVADELAGLRQRNGDPLTRPLFEIKDQDEKERIQAEEHHRRLAALGVVSPTVPVHNMKPTHTVDLVKPGKVNRTPLVVEEDVAPAGRAAAFAPERDAVSTADLASDADDADENTDDQEVDGGAITTSDARPRRRSRS